MLASPALVECLRTRESSPDHVTLQQLRKKWETCFVARHNTGLSTRLALLARPLFSKKRFGTTKVLMGPARRSKDKVRDRVISLLFVVLASALALASDVQFVFLFVRSGGQESRVTQNYIRSTVIHEAARREQRAARQLAFAAILPTQKAKPALPFVRLRPRG